MKNLLPIALSILLATTPILSGCNNNSEDIDESDIYFPAAQTLMDYPLTSATGTLIFNGKYLIIEADFVSVITNYLVIWPYGYSVNVEGGEIQILDESGQVAAHVGDVIKLGGGGVTKEIVEEYYIRESLPDDCENPYWDDTDDGEPPYFIAFTVEVVE